MADHQRKAGPRLHVMYKVIWPVNWMDWKTRAGSHSTPKGPRGCASQVWTAPFSVQSRGFRGVLGWEPPRGLFSPGNSHDVGEDTDAFRLCTPSVLSQVEARWGGTARWWPFLHELCSGLFQGKPGGGHSLSGASPSILFCLRYLLP